MPATIRLIKLSKLCVLILFFGSTSISTSYANNEIKQTCRLVGKHLSGISYKQCLKIKLSLTQHYSHRKTPLLKKQIDNNRTVDSQANSQANSPKVLLIAAIHGDEKPSAIVAFNWLTQLSKSKNNPFNWLFIPVANPDGLFDKKLGRVNARGIDINRNFPNPTGSAKMPYLFWKVRKQAKRYYPGRKPASESETKALIAIAKEYQPDIIISIHTPLKLIDYDGLPHHAPTKIGKLPLRLLNSYPGSLGSYFWYGMSIPVLTLEFGLRTPSLKQQKRVWKELQHWLKQHFQKNHQDSQQQTELFKQGLANLALNQLHKAQNLFAQITEPSLLSAAQNNRAYALFHQNHIAEAVTIWQLMVSQNHQLSTINRNLKLATEALEYSDETITPDLRLLQLPSQQQNSLNRYNELAKRLTLWQRARNHGNSTAYFNFYHRNNSPKHSPNHSPHKRLNHRQWKQQQQRQLKKFRTQNLLFSNPEIYLNQHNNQAIIHIKQTNQTTKKSTTLQLTWQKTNQNNRWEITQQTTTPFVPSNP